MKRIISALLFIAVLSFVADAQEKTLDPSKGSIITFEESSYDFGDIKQGDVVEYTFNFENSGNKPLILANVKTTCGCTAPTWPKEPVMPGESGEILVRFNSRGKIGVQNKTITVYSNAQNSPEKIRISTNVKKESDL